MTTSGFCAWPSPGSHEYCRSRATSCTCACHTEAEAAARLDAAAEALAAGYTSESDNIPAGESGEGQGT